MSRTAMSKMVAKEFRGVSIQEAFRLVNNCIRDRILVAVQHHDVRWDANRRGENKRIKRSLRYMSNFKSQGLTSSEALLQNIKRLI